MNYEKFFILKHLDLNTDVINKLWKELSDDERLLYNEGFINDKYKDFIRAITMLVKTHLNQGEIDFYLAYGRKFIIHFLFNDIMRSTTVKSKNIDHTYINSSEAENMLIKHIKEQLKIIDEDDFDIYQKEIDKINNAYIQIVRIQSIIKRNKIREYEMTYIVPKINKEINYYFIRCVLYDYIPYLSPSVLHWIYKNVTHNMRLNEFIFIHTYEHEIFRKQRMPKDWCKDIWSMLCEDIIKILPYTEY